MRELNSQSLSSMGLQSGNFSWSCALHNEWSENKMAFVFALIDLIFTDSVFVTHPYMIKKWNKNFKKLLEVPICCPSTPSHSICDELGKKQFQHWSLCRRQRCLLWKENKYPLKPIQYISFLQFHHKWVVGYHSRSQPFVLGIKILNIPRMKLRIWGRKKILNISLESTINSLKLPKE